MKKNIEILEELATWDNIKLEKGDVAIENILNRLEQDERVIEEMAEYIKNEWGFTNKNEVIEHFRKKCE